MLKEFHFHSDPSLFLIIEVFDHLFAEDYKTCLVGGAEEPLYSPASEHRGISTIAFTRDYVSSALHEIAHWCIAGPSRRALVDYGYWYLPDGRSCEQQVAFEKVEVKPQAVERIFSYACGQHFRVSVDNLYGGCGASRAFFEALHEQTLGYCRRGLPHRAQKFVFALSEAFGQIDPLNPLIYRLEDLL